MRALVVEDDALMRLLLESVLRARGHDVLSCASSEDGLAAFEAAPVPLVLLDWMMEGMDGLELCRRLRTHPEGHASVVLVVTSRNQPEDLKAVLEAGADDYVSKPIDPERFMVRLAVAENQVRIRSERAQAQSGLATVLARLEQSYADLLSVLNELRVGSAIVDHRGQVTFLSHLARKLMGLPDELPSEGHWRRLLPLAMPEQLALKQLLERPLAARQNLSVVVEGRGGLRHHVELEVKDDPRDPTRRILLFYDVTEVQDLRRQLEAKARFHDLVGRSEPMRQVIDLIRDLAPMDTTVLIEGETGTGKELVARALHASSSRKDRPFIAVNTAGLSDELLYSQLFGHVKGSFTGAVQDSVGLFEAAQGGTIFLDEIGDMPSRGQTALLRALQEREITRLGETRPRKVDVRVIVATHRNLQEEVAKGTFRMDLYYRVRVARVLLPPLRQRREDIPLLVGAFLTQLRASTGRKVDEVGVDAMRLLMDHDWPGNVRELKSAVEFGVIRCKTSVLQQTDLPLELAQAPAPLLQPLALDPLDERARFEKALRQARGVKKDAARLLGISRATFYRRLETFEKEGDET